MSKTIEKTPSNNTTQLITCLKNRSKLTIKSNILRVSEIGIYRLKKVSSKFEVYEFLVFNDFQLLTRACFSWTSPVDSAWLKVSISTFENKGVAAVS